jgi:S-adenosylmethionine hydrolase
MPPITFLTDYGLADSYVAEVKGALLTRVPDAGIVDITHEIPPGDIRSGAYVLGRAWRSFPEGTVHLAVVDPGVGTGRAALAVRSHGHYFVAPDNGLLTYVLSAGPFEAVELPSPDGASPTFHGRDVFAPAAARIHMGYPLHTLGLPTSRDPVLLDSAAPRYEGKSVVGQVVYVDRFGTLVTNLTAEEVPPYAVLMSDDIEIGTLQRTFGDVATGGLVAYLGSGGLVEIAVRDGSAARRLGIGVGHDVRARLG